MKCSNWKEKNTFIQTPFGKQSPHHAAPKQNSSPVPSGLLCSRGWGCGSSGSRGTAALQVWGGSEPPFV